MLKSFIASSAIVAVMGVAMAASAQAQDVAEDGFYVRVGAGANFVSDLEQGFTNNLLGPVAPAVCPCRPPIIAQSIDAETGFLASAAIGFDYADGFRTELEYRYATSPISIITPTPDPTSLAPDPPLPPVSSEEDLNAHFVFANFYYDWRNSSAITPFIGAGVGGAFVQAVSSAGGSFASTNSRENDVALAYQGRAGISWALREGFSADLEYVYTRTNTLRYGPDPEDFTTSGPFETAIDGDNYQSSSVMVSLRKQF